MRWLLILLPLFFAAANVAAHEPRALQFSYEIRLRDVAIGRTRMTVEPKKLVDGKLVRVLHSDGEALELAKAFYNGRASYTTWVNEHWQPLVAKWRIQITQRSYDVDAQFTADRVHAVVVKPGEQPVTVDQETPQHALDLVSFLPWLMQQKLKLGRQFHAQVHTGLRVCEVDIAIKDPETILVPLGERKAIVVQLDVTKCKKDRKITMWLDSKDFVPHRMMVEDAFIGWVEVLLTKVATVKPNFLPMPPPL